MKRTLSRVQGGCCAAKRTSALHQLARSQPSNNGIKTLVWIEAGSPMRLTFKVWYSLSAPAVGLPATGGKGAALRDG